MLAHCTSWIHSPAGQSTAGPGGERGDRREDVEKKKEVLYTCTCTCENVFCAWGDFLMPKPEGHLWPRELWSQLIHVQGFI